MRPDYTNNRKYNRVKARRRGAERAPQYSVISPERGVQRIQRIAQCFKFLGPSHEFRPRSTPGPVPIYQMHAEPPSDLSFEGTESVCGLEIAETASASTAEDAAVDTGAADVGQHPAQPPGTGHSPQASPTSPASPACPPNGVGHTMFDARGPSVEALALEEQDASPRPVRTEASWASLQFPVGESSRVDHGTSPRRLPTEHSSLPTLILEPDVKIGRDPGIPDSCPVSPIYLHEIPDSDPETQAGP